MSCGPPLNLQPPGRQGWPKSWYIGRCRSDETCVDHLVDDDLWVRHKYSTARCVHQSKFAKQIKATIAKAVQRITLKPKQTNPHSMGLVFTTEVDNTAYFRAYYVTVAAQDDLYNVLGGTKSCSDCGSLYFDDLPTGTTSFDANITLPHVNETANVFSFTWDS